MPEKKKKGEGILLPAKLTYKLKGKEGTRFYKLWNRV